MEYVPNKSEYAVTEPMMANLNLPFDFDISYRLQLEK